MITQGVECLCHTRWLVPPSLPYAMDTSPVEGPPPALCTQGTPQLQLCCLSCAVLTAAGSWHTVVGVWALVQGLHVGFRYTALKTLRFRYERPITKHRTASRATSLSTACPPNPTFTSVCLLHPLVLIFTPGTFPQAAPPSRSPSLREDATASPPLHSSSLREGATASVPRFTPSHPISPSHPIPHACPQVPQPEACQAAGLCSCAGQASTLCGRGQPTGAHVHLSSRHGTSSYPWL